jgi:hypothetical protein
MRNERKPTRNGYVGQAAIRPNPAEADGSIHCFAHTTIA